MQNTEKMSDNYQALDHLLQTLKALDDRTVEAATLENPWFSNENIRYATMALAEGMLDPEKLRQWVSAYPSLPVSRRMRVGVIAAGNLPLVGFFDLLCVVMSGHQCVIKPSSKDRVLMEFVVGILAEQGCAVSLGTLSDIGACDAVIATGSDSTRELFSKTFADRPTLMRGSRVSVAVLSGHETSEQLEKLGLDIFMHCGLGCRNVSKLFVPADFDLTQLIEPFSKHHIANRKYTNNYRHNRSQHLVNAEPFLDGGFFTLTESPDWHPRIAEITVTRYDHLADVSEELVHHETQIQCVVSDDAAISHRRLTSIGSAQMPALTDYPDGIDVMLFLENI